jgi:thiamine biosynthesis protein ThiI
MLDKVIVIRYGEIHLKGRNRGFFESTLIKNIKRRLSCVECKFTELRSRYVVSEYKDEDEDKIIEILKHIFGIHSISKAFCVDSDIDTITSTCVSLSHDEGTFKVETNRADKRFPMTSVELSKYLGGKILEAHPHLSVDLYEPSFTVNVDLREDGKTFVYSEKIACAGGMPTGTAGKGLVLLSGGIDSPVACYMMAKRGLKIDALHFHSYPYTSAMAKQKVEDLARILARYCGNIMLNNVRFTKIQEEIHRCCDPSYMITIMRCCMMRIAESVAKARGCGCIINGESLGQVASQTLESIYVTNARIIDTPIFRPCIGMDKEEIIDVARKIGTFDTSIMPYEDCCTVFLPDSPVIKPDPGKVSSELSKIPDLDALISEAVDSIEIVKIS